jgi:predicted TIM-barrel fold metal-dependent hydrolase
MSVTPERARKAQPEPALGELIDCDVHNALTSPKELLAYLPTRQHAYYDQLPGRRPDPYMMGARPLPLTFSRRDAKPPNGPPGSDLSFLQAQLLDLYGVRKAILSPLDSLNWPQYGDLAGALAAALNDWIVERWLEADDRLYASITVATEDTERAVAEIHRSGGADDRFVQVLLLVGTREPLGHPKYWPIYEAAVAHGLPIGLHVGGFSGALTGTGTPLYYLARHSGHPHYFQAQVVSLVASGVFDRFPSLQLVLEEGRIAWMPSLMWRLDRSWAVRREEVPHLAERPSAIIRRHFWFTTQPMDEPERPEYLAQTLDQLGMSDRVMFASDYPHWDFDAPDRALRTVREPALREQIYSANAQTLYRFRSS